MGMAVGPVAAWLEEDHPWRAIAYQEKGAADGAAAAEEPQWLKILVVLGALVMGGIIAASILIKILNYHS
jgi:hypothetical protein